jgi:hypothetical protein
MPRSVQRIAGSLLRVPEHHMIELFRIDPRALNRTLPRNRAQLLRRKVLQLPAVPPKGRASPAYDSNVTGF